MKRIKENAVFLKAASTAHPQQGKALVQTAKQTQLDAICEILVNILRGTIRLKETIFKKASRYKRILRQLATKCFNKKLRKELMVKYFGILQKLLASALPVLGLIIGGMQLNQLQG